MTMTVRPLMAPIARSISPAVSGSRPEAGSSKMSTSAGEHSARATARRVFSPPERAAPRSPPACSESSEGGSAAFAAASSAPAPPENRLILSLTVPSKRKVSCGM